MGGETVRGGQAASWADLTDAQLADAVWNGWLTPPALPGTTVPPRKPVTTFRQLMHELRRDREER